MSHDPASPQILLVETVTHGRVLVAPAGEADDGRWLIGFHGYGQSADSVLPALRASAPPGWRVASVQGLHRFYARDERVVASWMTRQDRDAAISDNVLYVDRVVTALTREHGEIRSLAFAGFSQGVAMAYRAAIRGRHRAALVAVTGGDLPPELKEPGERDWPPVLAATGARDPVYTPAALETDLGVLRTRSPHVESLVFDGGHEWSEAVTNTTRERLTALPTR